jgi:hypothetical protein
MRTVVLLACVISLGCQAQSKVELTDAPDRAPRAPQDTFGRLEFVIRTRDQAACTDCKIAIRWPGPGPAETSSVAAQHVSQGTLGALGPGPYELRVEGPGVRPLVQPLDLPRRQTRHADVWMAPAAR